MTADTQNNWISRAQTIFPAGGFGNFDPGIIIRSGKGSKVFDENGKEYLDLLIGSGPMILGHGNEEVMEAILEQLPKGTTFFANNAPGIELAEIICDAMPCGEQLRYVSTGGEADMYAIRLARAFTGRDKIVKFEGGYHGMSAEAQMSLAPSREVNFPQAVPDSAGIPESVAAEVLIAPYNDMDFACSLIAEYRNEIAAIIVEPLQRIIPPIAGFLDCLRQECDKYGIILVFDEVVTGFRLAYGGAQEHYGVVPDLCTLGKPIGGGFPLAATVGRTDIMAHFDKQLVGPRGFLMQVGTLSGNPIASVAGMKTLEILKREGAYERFYEIGRRVINAFSKPLREAGHVHQIVGHETLFDIVFLDRPVKNYRDIMDSNIKKQSRFNALLRERGIFKAPSKIYPSLALSDADIAFLEEVVTDAARHL